MVEVGGEVKQAAVRGEARVVHIIFYYNMLTADTTVGDGKNKPSALQ